MIRSARAIATHGNERSLASTLQRLQWRFERLRRVQTEFASGASNVGSIGYGLVRQ